MNVIAARLACLQPASPVVWKNLVVVPLVGPHEPAPPFHTLDEAIAEGTFHIMETGPAGTVPELSVVNEGSIPVLLLDGEELVGCKQNRVLNLTVLVPAHVKLAIPVSCVEQGRWSSRSAHFASADRTLYARNRASKLESVSEAMASGIGRRSDQGAIWSDIEAKAMRMGSASDTMAAGRLFEDHAVLLGKAVDALGGALAGPGAVFLVNGKPRGIELFADAKSLASYGPKIIRSYALDALDESGPGSATVDMASVTQLLGALSEASCESFPALGSGYDLRLSGPRIVGAALKLEGDTVMHLCAFSREEAASARPGGSRISRRSHRHVN